MMCKNRVKITLKVYTALQNCSDKTTSTNPDVRLSTGYSRCKDTHRSSFIKFISTTRYPGHNREVLRARYFEVMAPRVYLTIFKLYIFTQILTVCVGQNTQMREYFTVVYILHSS